MVGSTKDCVALSTWLVVSSQGDQVAVLAMADVVKAGDSEVKTEESVKAGDEVNAAASVMGSDPLKTEG